MNAKEKALKLPQKPGVYIMLDRSGAVIYVGKAKKLYNRVNSYFRSNSSHNAKTRKMVSQINDFDYIITDTEFEALVLENSLIKRHMPKYNILLKDDKGYPFIRLDDRKPYPRFSIVSKKADDGAKYFGPYGGRSESKKAIEAVSEVLKLPTCSRKFPNDIGKGRPCLNSHIGRCDAVCAGRVSESEYREKIARACMILDGKTDEMTKILEKKMLAYADKLEFELAGKVRDEIRAVNALSGKQKIISSMMSDTDVFGLYTGDSRTAFAVLHYIDGTLHSSEIKMTETPVYADEKELLEEFVLRYYSGRTTLPRDVYIQHELSSMETLSDWLTELAGRRVRVSCPKRGEKLKSVRMAAQNAEEKALAEMKRFEREKKVLKDLQKILALEKLPSRIEAYDISNTSGTETVAGMIVFKDGSPTRSEYRKFKIKTFDGQDDPRAMAEVVERRFNRYNAGDEKFSELPDLVLLDGGITQLNAVLEVFGKMGIGVPVFGMVKNDKHSTRALIDAYGREAGISASPSVFGFVTAVQEEVHRYSIDYHRKRRGKAITGSSLTKIDGVGSTRAKELLKRFGSITAIKNAEIIELESVVPKNTAQAVYEYYHSNSKEE